MMAPILVMNNESMITKLLNNIKQNQSGTTYSAPDGKPWIDFSIGTKHLCAVPKDD